MTAAEQAERAEHALRSQLAGEIEARKGELANRAFERMYENPFWDARFGERGRSFSAEDGQYHVTYLVEALRSGNQRVFTRYARWLQSVLTTRGMCSLHLAENFARLSGVIAESGIRNPVYAVAMLDAGVAALRYDSGAARAVQEEVDALLSHTPGAINATHPNLPSVTTIPGREQVARDMPYLLSYLADALALDRPGVFVDHARWLAEYYTGLDIPLDHLDQALLALDGSLNIPRAADRLAVRAIVREARAGLEGGA